WGAAASVRFFFQAEDGIRDGHVTGVQTCALPISPSAVMVWIDGGGYWGHGWGHWDHDHHGGWGHGFAHGHGGFASHGGFAGHGEIGRASCRERVESGGVGVDV